jgi:predicted nucleic acid-binding protein
MVWCYPDEQSDFAYRVLDELKFGKSVFVPSLWAVEIANALLVGERRNRLTQADVTRFLSLLESLPLKTDEQTSLRALNETLQLARLHGLTAYDATYLELAMRENLTLATLDAKLKAAAERVGVPVFA